MKKADPSFDYEPEAAAPAGDTASPDAFANAFAKDKNVTTGQCCTTPAGGETGITQEQLSDIVNMMMKTLKGEN